MGDARQIQVVVRDEAGAALWSTPVPLPAAPMTPEQAYDVALQVAHITELLVGALDHVDLSPERAAVATHVVKGRPVI